MVQLIEADFQLVMRIFINFRNNRAIERDKRLSKYNFSSRRGYAIEEALLEKYLFYDSTMQNNIKVITTIIDLEAYYDRQLLNIEEIVEEAVGIDRKAIKLIIKVLPRIEHYVHTKFGISSMSYSSELEYYVGTG